ncbi:DUF934 domain-containing protein [Algirhabdus cladophorae]|uniref:DUF934 domain-containing protein n=1 Tax=Algirhabdus cladophorae TaxID=3377108 RepID=UPI003B847F7A
MSVLINDDGFHADDWDRGFVAVDALPANEGGGVVSVDLPSDADLASLGNRLIGADIIRIDFPSFADGRGFTLAAQLRRLGFQGRLRAKGHVIADQYPMARRSGFDEVEISDDLAARQPVDQWLARANWRAHDYQARMRG